MIGVYSPRDLRVLEEQDTYVPQNKDCAPIEVVKTKLELKLPEQFQEPEPSKEVTEWVNRVEKKVLGRSAPEDDESRMKRLERRRSISQRRFTERKEARKEKNAWVKRVMKKNRKSQSSEESQMEREEQKKEREERHRRKEQQKARIHMRPRDDDDEHYNVQLAKDKELFQSKAKSIKDMKALFQQKMVEASTTKTSTIVPVEITQTTASTPQMSTPNASTPRSTTTSTPRFNDIMGAKKTPRGTPTTTPRGPSKKVQGTVDSAAIDFTTVKKPSYVQKSATFRM